jgi:hypothetical protein
MQVYSYASGEGRPHFCARGLEYNIGIGLISHRSVTSQSLFESRRPVLVREITDQQPPQRAYPERVYVLACDPMRPFVQGYFEALGRP